MLEIQRDDPDAMAIDSAQIVFGLKDVLWRGGEHSYEVVGHGSHPREHETYMFFANKSNPGGADRFVYITPDGPAEEWPDYRIELAVQAILVAPDAPDPNAMLRFSGTLPPPHKEFPDRLQFRLIQAPLTATVGPVKTIYVSGKIIAKAADDEKFDELVESYESALRQER